MIVEVPMHPRGAYLLKVYLSVTVFLLMADCIFHKGDIVGHFFVCKNIRGPPNCFEFKRFKTIGG